MVDTIRKELLKYSADQVGRFDFALENAGGQIAASSETYDMSSSRVKLLGLTLPIRVSRLHPTAVIQVGRILLSLILNAKDFMKYKEREFLSVILWGMIMIINVLHIFTCKHIRDIQ